MEESVVQHCIKRVFDIKCNDIQTVLSVQILLRAIVNQNQAEASGNLFVHV